MQHGILLSGAALAMGLVGCAAGSSYTGPIGSGGATSSASSTGSAMTTASSSSSSTNGGNGGSGDAEAASSTTGPSTSATTGNGGSTGSGPPPKLPLGSPCSMDSDCTDNLCKPVVIDSPAVCVSPCTKQSDCGSSPDFFCEPISPGSTSGYCIPHSPAHCLSCDSDADCGSLSEVCIQATGDTAKACNIDCSLAGQAACPPEYDCVDQMVAGMARKLCRPGAVQSCLNNIGGYCDRLAAPQICALSNANGTCAGERVCLAASKRFDRCDAMQPQCLTDCSMTAPAACTGVPYCSSAVTSVANCGTCGKPCPGNGALNANVACNSGSGGSTCSFSCQGENYDVDNNPANGCEVADSPQANHTQTTTPGSSAPADAGNAGECDSGTLNDIKITGRLISDKRVHSSPSIIGFDTASGSAPDWYMLTPVNNTSISNPFCDNDVVMQLTVKGSSSPACYRLSVITNKGTYTCQTNASGSCPTANGCPVAAGICVNGGGAFATEAAFPIEVQKTCSTSVTENVTYTISGHL